MTTTLTATRNASLADLAAILQDDHARKIDMIVPASQIRAVGSNLQIVGAEQIVDADGVTDPNGLYVPTRVVDEHVADKLGIPLPYLRRMADQRPDLWAANVNGWLHGGSTVLDGEPVTVGPDSRSFLLRTFRSDGVDEWGNRRPGVARAFLSSTYKIVDNLDVLTAALEGVRESGVDVHVDGCDLSERRMYVRIAAPAVAALAPTLLAGYRSPFTGASGTDNPTVFAGFELSNSEVGGGAFTITPRLVVQVCNNGMKITKDALRSIHLGSKMDDGVIRWSDDTQQRNLELVRAQTRDAVATFLDVDYVRQAIQKIEADAEAPVADAAATIEHVSKQLRFGEVRTAAVLDHFIRGGQMTAGGILNAVTSVAQTISDPDDAAEFEASAIPAMQLAAAAV